MEFVGFGADRESQGRKEGRKHHLKAAENTLFNSLVCLAGVSYEDAFLVL